MVNYGIDPQYFKDEMTYKEVNAVIEANNLNEQSQWERTRVICSFILASFSTQKADIKNVMPFSWDKKEDKEIKKPITKEDKEKMKEIEKIINKIKTPNNG